MSSEDDTSIAAGDEATLSPVRASANRDEIDEASLVVAAAGLPYQVTRTDDGNLELLVRSIDHAAAVATLAEYDRERTENAPPPAAPERGQGTLGVIVAGVIATIGVWAGVSESIRRPAWFTAGIADASLIRSGQMWRAVTAMTLHGDLMHLLGNAAGALIFVTAAARWLGSGVAALLLVLAGAAANLLTAIAEKPEHRSLGASTAVFAALGIVAGLQALRRWRGGGRLRRKAWVSLGAGLALFAMLGVSEHADVFAHLFGLGVGFVVGMTAGVVDRPSAGPAAAPGAAITRRTIRPALVQIATGLAAAATVGLAWWRALRSV